jgi:hypothetical protein
MSGEGVAAHPITPTWRSLAKGGAEGFDASVDGDPERAWGCPHDPRGLLRSEFAYFHQFDRRSLAGWKAADCLPQGLRVATAFDVGWGWRRRANLGQVVGMDLVRYRSCEPPRSIGHPVPCNCHQPRNKRPLRIVARYRAMH